MHVCAEGVLGILYSIVVVGSFRLLRRKKFRESVVNSSAVVVLVVVKCDCGVLLCPILSLIRFEILLHFRSSYSYIRLRFRLPDESDTSSLSG